jgi:maleylacetoacetate isomerase/maleylpyruvate isomerase
VRLYSYFRSSAAYRVRIALNLKGVPFEQRPVNLLKGEQAGDAFAAVNPQKRVPALDIGGTILIQSPAILEYLDEVHPEPPLLPVGAVQRARVRAVAAVVGCDVHPLNNLGPLRYLKNTLQRAQPDIDAWYRHWIEEGFAAIEQLVSPGPFAFGDRVSLADVYLVPQVYNARRFDVCLDRYPKIAGIDAACAAVDAFAEAVPERQPDAV